MKRISFIALLFSLAISAQADVTLQFSQISVGRATGFANSAGIATNGMAWGIVVSTTNSVFSGGSYDIFDPTLTGFLKINGVDTDDYYVTSGLTTSSLGATGGDPGGAGGITTLNPVPFGGATGISQNDPFSIIWFETTPANNSKYGLLSNVGFVIPADGTGTSFAGITGTGTIGTSSYGVFGGSTADPAKPANLTFSSTAIPEPSRMMLLGFGLVGFFFRRRR